MAKIEVISEAQAMVESAKGKKGAHIRTAIEALQGLQPGKSLRIEPGPGESIAGWKKSFGIAGSAVQMVVEVASSGGKLYVWARPDTVAIIDAIAAEQLAPDEALTLEHMRQALSPDEFPVLPGMRVPADLKNLPLEEQGDSIALPLGVGPVAPPPADAHPAVNATPPYDGSTWTEWGHKDIATEKSIPLQTIDLGATMASEPLVEVLLPKHKRKTRWYCNPVTMHTEHQHREMAIHEGEQPQVYCVWKGPRSRMPTVKEAVLVK